MLQVTAGQQASIQCKNDLQRVLFLYEELEALCFRAADHAAAKERIAMADYARVKSEIPVLRSHVEALVKRFADRLL